jgi:hypothetical protein
MRFFFILFCFLLSALYGHAQDIIYKSDGSQKKGKVQEVNESQVKYKNSTNLEGPTFVIKKDDVLKIAYESGIVEEFSEKTTNSGERNEYPISKDFGSNFISINVIDLAFSGFLTLSYERTLKSGNFSYRIPLSLGLKNSDELDYYEGYYNKGKIFSTGFDFYIYPSGQGRARYFMGPSLEYGRYNYLQYDYYSINNIKKVAAFYSILFQNGFLFQPSKHFNISVNVGVGYTKSILNSEYHYIRNHGDFTFRGGLNMGYKF